METAVRESVEPEVATRPSADTGPIARLWLWVKAHHLFLLTVVLPTLVATAYYGFIASNVYVSISEFIIHSPQQPAAQTTGLLGEFLAGAGITRSQNAAYAVKSYIRSRDALHELDAKLHLRKVFGSSGVDIIDRFPGLYPDQSFEEFYRYFGRHVGITYDPVSSISVLTVNAYTPQSAYEINRLLLSMSQRLVNSLNERSRQDTIKYAAQDVKVAERKATQASLALLAYRSTHAVFAPNQQAGIELQGIAKLQGELVSTEAELAELKQLSPSNPEIPGLRSRTATLRAAIAGQASRVTGASGSLSARAPEFEQLALQSNIADKELGAALAELDAARRDAARQQLYLERLVPPNLPDDSLLPKRFKSIFTVFVVGLILWGVLSLVLASVREHTE